MYRELHIVYPYQVPSSIIFHVHIYIYIYLDFLTSSIYQSSSAFCRLMCWCAGRTLRSLKVKAVARDRQMKQRFLIKTRNPKKHKPRKLTGEPRCQPSTGPAAGVKKHIVYPKCSRPTKTAMVFTARPPHHTEVEGIFAQIVGPKTMWPSGQSVYQRTPEPDTN